MKGIRWNREAACEDSCETYKLLRQQNAIFNYREIYLVKTDDAICDIAKRFSMRFISTTSLSEYNIRELPLYSRI